MLLPSGPDMVRGLYCTGPEARYIYTAILPKASYGITPGETSTEKRRGAIRSETQSSRNLRDPLKLSVYAWRHKSLPVFEPRRTQRSRSHARSLPTQGRPMANIFDRGARENAFRYKSQNPAFPSAFQCATVKDAAARSAAPLSR